MHVSLAIDPGQLVWQMKHGKRVVDGWSTSEKSGRVVFCYHDKVRLRLGLCGQQLQY